MSFEINRQNSKMSFWALNEASPKLWHTLGYWNADFLRKTPCPCPTVLPGFSQYRRLTIYDIDSVCAFMKDHYGDSDWYIDADPSWLRTYFEDPSVIILGLFDENTLVATILSTPISPGNTYIGSYTYFRTIRVIEGLCVHKQFRKKGIAAYMISAMDYETSRTEPCIHLWSRELPSKPVFSTHLNAKTYGYIDCSVAKPTMNTTRMPWDEFSTLWENSSIHWVHTNPNSIVSTLPSNRRGGLTVWSVECGSEKIILIISDTKRKTKQDHSAIWEVIWVGKIESSLLVPSTTHPYCIESVASQLKGLVFVMTEYGISSWNYPWRIGTSGIHAWYIYNYLPPTFGNCELHTVREEL